MTKGCIDMKKISVAILSLAMCAAMLTACGNDSAVTDVIDAETVTTAVETVTVPELTAAETAEVTTTAEPEDETAAKYSYESLDDFIGEAFALETETFEESLFLKYAEENISADGLYFDMETPDGSMKMLLAYQDNNMCVKAESADGSVYIYVIDEKMYMLDTEEKTGFSMTLDEDTVNSLTSEAMGGIDIEAELEGEELTSECVEVEVEGTAYTFENLEEIGVLFDKDGKLYAIINGDTDEAVRAFIVNEMSSNVPEGIIALPTDYEIVDMSALLAELEEEDDSGEPVKTEFASMEEFLKADFSEFEGTEYSAGESLTAEIARIMYESTTMYASSNYGGEQMTVAMDKNKVMLEGDFGDTGEMIKFIFIGDKFYTVMDSERTVLTSSSDELGTAEEIIELSKESFSDIPSLSDEKMMSAEVTIAGKKYTIEYDKSAVFGSNFCMIFDENKNLYGMAEDGVFSAWIITEDIPEGIFDIPSDYEIIDLDDYE